MPNEFHSRFIRKAAFRLLSAIVLFGFLSLSHSISVLPAGAQTNEDFYLALVLAIDCSVSVDTSEFRLQMQGLGQAFRHKEIHDAIAQGNNGRIAVSVLQWSDDSTQLHVAPVSVISE